MTVSHNDKGVMTLIYGGADTPLNTWFPYQRVNTATGTVRALKTTKIGFANMELGTNVGNNMYMTIENNIPGLLYKTGKLSKPEQLRQKFSDVAKCDVSYSMQGPMVNIINFNNRKCSDLSKLLGLLTMTPSAGGPDLTIDISPFLKASGSSCQL